MTFLERAILWFLVIFCLLTKWGEQRNTEWIKQLSQVQQRLNTNQQNIIKWINSQEK